MSLKKANISENILSVITQSADGIIDLTKNGSDLIKIIKSFDNIDDIGKVLNLTGVSKGFVAATLKANGMKDMVDDVINAMDGFEESQKGITGIANAFGGLTKIIAKNAYLLSTLAGIFATAFIVNKIDKDYINYDAGMKSASEASTSYKEESEKYDQINSQLKEKRDRIKEINTLISNGQGTLALKGELETLKQETAELELQKQIQKEIRDAKGIEVAEKTADAFSRKKDSNISKKSSGGVNDYEYSEKVDVFESAKEQIAYLKSLKEEKTKLEKDIKDGNGDKRSNQIRLDYIKKELTDIGTSLANDIEDIQNGRSNLVDKVTGKAIEGYEDLVDKADSVLELYADYSDSFSTKQAKALEKIWENDSFAQAQQKIVDAFRNGKDISIEDFTNQFPELVSECDRAGISVETLREELMALASTDAGLTQLETNFETFKITAVNAINSLDALNAAFVNSFSGKGLSVDIDSETGELTGDIINVMAAYKNLEGYDVFTLFERTANGVHLNREALRALQAEQEALQRKEFSEKELELQKLINDALSEREGLTGDDYTAQTAIINDLQNQLDTVQLLASAYEGATSAYQKWLDAQSNGEDGDMYREVSDTMRERGKELWKEGRYNTEEFRAIAQFYSNQDLSTASMEQVVSAYKNSVEKINRYFTGDKQGIDNFMYDMMNDAELLAQGVVKTLDDGTMEFVANSDKILADRFGISEEAIQSILRAASEYNDKIRIGDLGSDDLTQKLAEATQKAEEAKTKLKELQEQGQISTDIQLDIDVSELDESAINDRINSLEELKKSASLKFGEDSSEVEYVNDLLDEAIARKEQLAQTTNVSLSVDINGEEDINILKEKLSSLPSDTDSNVTITISNEDQLDNTVEQLEMIPSDASTNISFNVSNQDEADIIQEKIEKLNENREIPINATFNVTDNSGDLNKQEVEAKVNYTLGEQAPPKDMDAKVNYKSDSANKKATVSYSKDSSSVDSYNPSNKTAKVKFTKDSSIPDKYQPSDKTAKVNYTLGTIPSYNPKNLERTLTYNVKVNGKIPGQSSGTLYGVPSHAQGTAYNMLNLKPAYVGGKVALSKDELAVVNELGTEGLIRNGKLYPIPGGMHMESLKKGDIILSVNQMQKLFSGQDAGRARAYSEGTASIANAYSSSSYWTFGNTGSGNLKGTGYSPVPKKTATKTTKQDATKATDDVIDFVKILRDCTKEYTEILSDAIDDAIGLADKMAKNSSALSQIQKEISVNQQAYDKYMAQAGAVGLSESYASQVRNGSLNIENITNEDLKKKIEDYQKWYNEAKNCKETIRQLQKDEQKLALSRLEYIEDFYDAVVKLNDAYKDVNDTRIDLNDMIGNSAIGTEIQNYLKSSYDKQYDSYNQALSQLGDYQNEFNELLRQGYIKEGSESWYEGQAKIQEFTKQVDESAIALIELEDKIRAIDYTKLQQIIDGSNRRTDQLKNAQSLAEARDELIGRDELQKQVNELSKSINANYELRDKKLQEQNLYDVTSTRYQDLAKEIADLDNEIYGNLIDIEDLKNQIFEAEFFNYEKEQENLEYFIGELDDFSKLLNEEGFFDRNGAFTDEAYAKIALTAEAMAKCKQETANATEALKKLDEMYQNGLISETEYTDKQRDLLDTVRQSTLATEDYKNELLDLYTEQIQKENDALKESISLRQKALKSQKSYWDYADSIKSKTKDVDALRAQIASLEGVTSASAIATKKKLEAELADAEKSLSDTKRDHTYSLMDEGYSAMSDNLDKSLEDIEYSIATSSEKQLQVVQLMLSQMVSSYQEASSKISSIMSNTGFVGSGSFNDTVTNIGSSTGSSSIASGATQDQSTIKPNDKVSNINTGNISNGEHGNIEEEIKKEPNTDNRLCAELKISTSSVSVQEGSSTSVSVSIRPNDAKNKTISWSSSNSSIASVSSDGKITGVKPGTATITASTTDGSGLVQTCKVTVTKKPEPPKPTTPPNSNITQGNGIPDVGDKVTFVSGIYHEDSYGAGRWGNWNLGQSVYITKINPNAPYPIHISTGNRLGSGDRGWLKLNQLRGYNRGSRYINRRQWAFMDDTSNGNLDAGSEVVITNRGILKQFEAGDHVFNNEQVQRLWDLSKDFDMSRFVNLNISSMLGQLPDIVNRNDNSRNTEVNLNFDSLMTIEGNVYKEAIPGLQKEIDRMIPHISDKLGCFLRSEMKR